MDKHKVVIYGTGKLAELVSYDLTHDGGHEVVAFCFDSGINPIPDHDPGNLPFTDFNTIEQSYPQDEYRLFIAIGNNWERERIFNKSKSKGYSFISHVSKRAIVSENLVIGENVFIDEGTSMHPFVTFGDNTIILATRIAHHSTIGNNCLLSSCVLGGNVTVGDNTFIGMHSAIQQNVVLGRNNIIGMLCNITEDTDDDAVYTEKATPKRAVSSEKLKDRFLL